MPRGVKTHKLDELDIMDLRVVLALYKTGGTHQAAQLLGVTQSMIVYRSQLVENYFQQAIYYRRSKGSYFTPFGLMLVQYAESILDLYTEMMLFAKSYKEVPNVGLPE